MDRPSVTGKVVKEEVISKDLKGHYVGYVYGNTWMFDPDGNYIAPKLGVAHEDDTIKEMIISYANAVITLIAGQKTDDMINSADLAWKLTPCKKPSKDYVKKCKISVLKDIIADYEKNRWKFDYTVFLPK